MKRTFLTTAAATMFVSSVSAEISVSGDGRLGIKYQDEKVQQSSRARVTFKMSEKTDTGIEFGAELRADHATKASDGAEGHVYASGKFGKISFGNNDGASYKANGELHNIFLEGNDDQDFLFFSTRAVAEKNPNILYEYTMGSTTFYASLMDGDAGDKTPKDFEDAQAIGAKYASDRFTAGIGFEQGTSYDIARDQQDYNKILKISEIDNTRVTASLEKKINKINVKGIFSTGKSGDETIHQYGGSGEYHHDAFKIAAFAKQQRGENDHKTHFAGLGTSYDLNDHAAIRGGIAAKRENGENTSYADLGIELKF